MINGHRGGENIQYAKDMKPVVIVVAVWGYPNVDSTKH